MVSIKRWNFNTKKSVLGNKKYVLLELKKESWIMKLKPDQKFILQDDDGNLILINEVDFDFNVLQNRIIPMKGVKFEIDYVDNVIELYGEVNIQTSFDIDGVYSD